MRSKELDLLKAIGIIYVVALHYHLPWIFQYPCGSFIIPLFYFISGYFFKSVDKFRLKLLYSLKKTKELILPYFLYELLFTIICYFLQKCLTINLMKTYWKNDLLHYPLVLVLQPVFGGISSIFFASWFVSDLWVTVIVTQFIYNNTNRRKRTDLIYFICFLLIALANIYWSHTSPRSVVPSILPDALPLLEHNFFKRICVRISVGSFFHFCGIAHREYIEKYQKLLFTGRNFCLAFIAITQIEYYYRNHIDIDYFNGEFRSGPIWLPILTSIIGIYIFMFIAKCASRYIDDDDILLKIGKETYHIMCQHILINLFLTIITISAFLDRNFKVLDGNITFKYKPEATWPIYVSFGLLLPTFSSIYIRKFMKKNSSTQSLPYTDTKHSI